MKKIVLSFAVISLALIAGAKETSATSQFTSDDYSKSSLSACSQSEGLARTNANSNCIEADSTSFLSNFIIINKRTGSKTENGYTTVTCTITAKYSCY